MVSPPPELKQLITFSIDCILSELYSESTDSIKGLAEESQNNSE